MKSFCIALTMKGASPQLARLSFHSVQTGGYPFNKEMDVYEKICACYGLSIDHAEAWGHARLVELFQNMADSASCEVDMFLLPLLTTVCGLMGIAVAETHRKNITFQEPNIIWSCVAAEPGARKSPAMRLITSSLEELQNEVLPGASTSLQGDDSLLFESNQIFIANENITMAKLHQLMYSNRGCYLNILDEVEGLFRSLEVNGGPDAKDRRTWLSLYNGSSWARSTKQGRCNMSTTRLNYTGYLQPELLIDRLEKGDVDGLLDRHWCCLVKRKKVLFEDIGEPKEGDCLTLPKLLRAIYDCHKGDDVNTYRLNDDAGTAFAEFYNSIEMKIDGYEEGGFLGYLNKKGVIGMLNKSSGQALRLAMVVQVMKNAADGVMDSRTINRASMDTAIKYTTFFNSQKHMLIGDNSVEDITSTEPFSQSMFDMSHADFLKKYAVTVRKLLNGDEDEISSSKVVQLKKCPPTPNNTYNSELAKQFMIKVAECGLGTIVRGKTKKSVVLKIKRKGEYMNSPAKRFMSDSAMKSVSPLEK